MRRQIGLAKLRDVSNTKKRKGMGLLLRRVLGGYERLNKVVACHDKLLKATDRHSTGVMIRTMLDACLYRAGWSGLGRQKYVQQNIKRLGEMTRLSEEETKKLFANSKFTELSKAAHTVGLGDMLIFINIFLDDDWNQYGVTKAMMNGAFRGVIDKSEDEYRLGGEDITVEIKKNSKKTKLIYHRLKKKQ